ncbi:hypothetical protein [Halorubrum aidingense]|uniref:hypothetical protein n=1 Tax=Halorubrum aidingense TaxID=368623 RepID=UPI001EF9F4B7|nr:hypothetical protein [Halorubrum aidingense]
MPDRTVEIAPRSGGHETATAAVLDEGTYVESTGVSAQSFDVDVTFNGDRRATWHADALETLGNNPAIGVLPLGGSTHAGVDGYYVASSTRRDPRLAEPPGADLAASDATESVTLTLERAGTRKRHVLAVKTAPSQPDPGHPFGNDTDAIVGLPADARRVRIVDATSSPTERERPTPVATVDAEHGAVDLFDATAEAIDEPVYLFDLDYDLQGDVDPGVWDTYGQADRLDEDGVVSWGRVFATAHDFSGSVVCENGLLRVTIDEPTNADETASLDVEEYDADADAWTTVALPEYSADLDTDWQPTDVDLTHIGQASVRAQVEFEAVAGDQEGDVYALDVELERGRSELEVWIPESVDEAIPADLKTMLEPIAATNQVDSGAEQGLVAREEVRL